MPWMCVGAPSSSMASAASGNMAVFSSTCASTLDVALHAKRMLANPWYLAWTYGLQALLLFMLSSGYL